MKNRKVINLVPYNREWPQCFEQAAQALHQILGRHVLDIHHIGSTAVPKLAAKPCIDICLVIDALPHARRLEKHGYLYKGEINIPGRAYFTKNTQDHGIHVHVCEQGHSFIPLNLSFRDYLRHHEADRKAYERLKYELLAIPGGQYKIPGETSKYCLGKDAFIKSIIEKSGFQEPLTLFCMHTNEQAYVARIIADKGALPYAGGLQERCFVLYHGVIIQGYAHIILHTKPQARCASIHLDKPHYRPFLCSTINTWLSAQGYNTPHEI